MKRKLLFILSSNYSGSHFLSLMLGSHSKAEHLGELKNLVKEDVECQLCADPKQCQLFRAVSSEPKERLYQTLFSRVPEDVSVLVDASKKPKWFKHFINTEDFDIRLIHLVRDPRALVRRWLMRFDEQATGRREKYKQIRRNPLHAFNLIFSDSLTVSVYKWYSQNREIKTFIENTGLPSKVVTYREIAMEPDVALEKLCEFTGLDYENAQKRYWEFEHHGTEKPQYREGLSNGSGIDIRWKEYLNPEQVSRIESNKAVNKLLAQLNLRYGRYGLEYID